MKRIVLKMFFLLIINTFTIKGQVTEMFEEKSVSITPFEYNTPGSEFAPALVGDTLFYPVIFKKKLKKKAGKVKKNSKFYNLQKTVLDKNGLPKGEPVHDEAKSSAFHDGPLCFCPTSERFFLTRSNLENAGTLHKMFKKKDVGLKIDIYNIKTKKTTPFKYNSDAYSVAQPAINVTGDTLYFTSDMPGGFGGKDLYRSVFRNGDWGEPENLGADINSEYDELYPSIGKNGTFFFSSARLAGKGGLDIYACRQEGNKGFSHVQLLDGGFNTAFDDFALVFSKNRDFGFFSSNRENRNDELYRVNIKGICKLQLTALDAETKTPIYSFTLSEPKNQAASWQGLNGNCQVPLSSGEENIFRVNAEGYLGSDFAIDAQRLSWGVHTDTVLMFSQYKLNLVVLDAKTKRPAEHVTIVNWDDDHSWEALKETCLLPLHSGKENVFFITSEGYADQSISVDTKTMSTSMMADTVLLYAADEKPIEQAIEEQAEDTPEFSDIFYAFNSRELTTEAKKILDKLATMLKKNAQLKVEFRSYTDARGSNAYNEVLSQKRSQACVSYLTKTGVKKERLAAKGFGETNPLNECRDEVECSEQGHAANRRTEIRIMP